MDGLCGLWCGLALELPLGLRRRGKGNVNGWFLLFSLPLRLLQRGKGNLDGWFLLISLPLGLLQCGKGNADGWFPLISLPLGLLQRGKGNVDGWFLLFWLPLGSHACFIKAIRLGDFSRIGCLFVRLLSNQLLLFAHKKRMSFNILF